MNNWPSLSTKLPPAPPPPSLPYASCGSVYNSSVSFSYGFTHNLDCQWIILIPSGYQLALMLRINIEFSGGGKCTKDYVRVQTHGQWSKRYCSKVEVRHDKITESTVMIQYHTDSTSSYNGGFTGLGAVATVTGRTLQVADLYNNVCQILMSVKMKWMDALIHAGILWVRLYVLVQLGCTSLVIGRLALVREQNT